MQKYKFITDAMRGHPTNSHLQTIACKALRNRAEGRKQKVGQRGLVSDKIDNVTKIEETGIIKCTIVGMRSYPTDIELQNSACEALGSLPCNNPEIKVKISDEDDIQCIASVMQSHQNSACRSLSDVLRMIADEMLEGCARLLQQHVRKIAAAGGIECLVTTMYKTHNFLQGLACSALLCTVWQRYVLTTKSKSKSPKVSRRSLLPATVTTSLQYGMILPSPLPTLSPLFQ